MSLLKDLGELLNDCGATLQFNTHCQFCGFHYFSGEHGEAVTHNCTSVLFQQKIKLQAEVDELKKLKGTVGFITVNERCDQLEQQLKEREAMIVEARELLSLYQWTLKDGENLGKVLKYIEKTKAIGG